MATVKMAILGAQKVGKTSIFNWVRDVANNFDRYNPTIGPEFRTVNIDSVENIRLHIWDTSGDERYRSLISIYTRGAAIICLVIDRSTPNSLEALAQLLNDAREYIGNDAQFIILGNQTTDENLIEEQAIRDFMTRDLPVNTLYIAVNPKNDTGKIALIDQLKNLVQKNKLEEVAARDTELSEEPVHSDSSSLSNVSMTVLNGFIVAVGIAAVAVAFTVLNAAALSMAGVAVAGTGVAAILVGFGMFAREATPASDMLNDEEQDLSCS